MNIHNTLLSTCAAFSLVLAPAAALAGDVVWWTPNWSQARAQKLADDFDAANPDITIKLQVTTSNGLPQPR